MNKLKNQLIDMKKQINILECELFYNTVQNKNTIDLIHKITKLNKNYADLSRQYNYNYSYEAQLKKCKRDIIHKTHSNNLKEGIKKCKNNPLLKGLLDTMEDLEIKSIFNNEQYFTNNDKDLQYYLTKIDDIQIELSNKSNEQYFYTVCDKKIEVYGHALYKYSNDKYNIYLLDNKYLLFMCEWDDEIILYDDYTNDKIFGYIQSIEGIQNNKYTLNDIINNGIF